MNTLYIILIILFTVILNITLTWLTPSVKVQFKLFKTYISRKFTRKQAVDCSLLEKRVADLEKQYKQRQINFKSRVREEVIEYLEQLKTK